MESRTRSLLTWSAAFALILSLSFAIKSAIAAATGGGFAYILDDPYIHMSMARNLVESGVWGVTRYEFSGASSSVLWIALLAIGEILFDQSEFVPLYLNIALAAILTALVHAKIQAQVSSGFKGFAILLVILFATPVLTLIFLGMEHLLQTILAILFVYQTARCVAVLPESDESQRLNHSNQSNRGGAIAQPAGFTSLALLAALAFLTTAVRYEGLFQIAAAGLFFVLQRRFAAAALIGAAGILAPAGYAAYSLAQGWPALPTPILLKGSLSGLLNIASAAEVLAGLEFLLHEKYLKHIHVPILILFAGVAYFRNRRRKSVSIFAAPQVLLGMFLLIAVQHLHLAGLGWYFRYEAYLVALGGILLALHWFGDSADADADADAENENENATGVDDARTEGAFWRRRLLTALLFLCGLRLAASLGWRAFVSVAGLSGSAGEIYSQQIQSARFFERYYSGQVVAANDIGAINYFSDIRCVDLFGLASHEVAHLRKNKTLTTAGIAALAQREGVQIAIVYDEWFESAGGLPADWRKAGEWTIPERTTVAQDTVAIYAVNENYATLVRRLQDFGATMPPEILQNVPYRKRANAAKRNKNQSDPNAKFGEGARDSTTRN
ncbi:MAG: hypothetical protein NXI24_07575 [bacterium]|nr:hypothetical protein [bacterium]